MMKPETLGITLGVMSAFDKFSGIINKIEKSKTDIGIIKKDIEKYMENSTNGLKIYLHNFSKILEYEAKNIDLCEQINELNDKLNTREQENITIEQELVLIKKTDKINEELLKCVKKLKIIKKASHRSKYIFSLLRRKKNIEKDLEIIKNNELEVSKHVNSIINVTESFDLEEYQNRIEISIEIKDDISKITKQINSIKNELKLNNKEIFKIKEEIKWIYYENIASLKREVLKDVINELEDKRKKTTSASIKRESNL